MGFDVYIGLEEAASQLSWHEQELVPGILETAAYARTLIEAGNRGADDEEISRCVHVRMARQLLIRRATAPLNLQVMLNEGILRRPVGGRRSWRSSLASWRRFRGCRTCRCGWPRSAPGGPPGVMSGPFVILRFPVNGDGRKSEPATVYKDGFTGGLYLDKPQEVELYAQAGGSHEELPEKAS